MARGVKARKTKLVKKKVIVKPKLEEKEIEQSEPIALVPNIEFFKNLGLTPVLPEEPTLEVEDVSEEWRLKGPKLAGPKKPPKRPLRLPKF